MNERLKYVDAMRGFTIVLVVYSHVLAYLVNHTYEDFNFYFLKFRMPLFFFISGFFIYSPDYSFEKLLKRTKNRLVRQLWPTIILCVIFIFTLYAGTPHGLIHSKFKGGYWFTLVAVEAFLLIAPLLFVMNSQRVNRRWQTGILLAIAGVVRLLFCREMLTTPNANLLSLIFLYDYLPFLILGVVFRINEVMLGKIVSSLYFFLVALILFFFSHNFIHGEMPLFDIEGISGVGIVYYLFSKIYQNKKVEGSKAASIVQHVGQNTLEIYLLHYFVIMGIVRWIGTGGFHRLRGMPGEFVAVLLIALVVTAITLLIAALLRRLHLYKLIFGK